MSIQRCCPPTRIVRTDFSGTALVLKALADPHRLSILATLARAEHEVCVCDFTDGLHLDQSTVSHHLRVLRESKLVTWERRGTWVYYALAKNVRKQLQDALDLILPQPQLV